MPNTYFKFKQFTIQQDKSAMKVTTDACLFGAWITNEIQNLESKIQNTLDIGTGTGLLALMLAQKIGVPIDAIELDYGSFEQASKNIAGSPWKDRIEIFPGDARNYDFSKKYDLIISNPPFYEKEIKSGDKRKNLAHHSEELPLKDLMKIIRANLSDNGRFFLLLPYKRNQEVSKLFRQSKIQADKIIFVRQSPTHDFFRIMISGRVGVKVLEAEFRQLSIKDDDGNYTAEFEDLLKDYYLKL